MTVRTIDVDTDLTAYEVRDTALHRSLFVDVMSDGVLLSIQYTGFETEPRGQIVLSFDDLNALTQLINELDRWV